MPLPRFERLSKVHRRFENQQVEMVFHRNFRDAFKRYLRNPQLIEKDASEMLSSAKVRRTDVYRGEVQDDKGNPQELVVKVTTPGWARSEFASYYRLLTGESLPGFSKLPHELPYPLLSSSPESLERVAKPSILVPRPIGYVIDKQRNKGYLVTRYVPGKTLEQLNLDELPRKERKNIIRQAALIHKALITRGVIHGDLRPRNFLLQKTPKGSKVYLLDPEFAHFVPLMTEDRRIVDFRTLQQALASQGGKWEDKLPYKIRLGDMRRYFRTLFPTSEERKYAIGNLRPFFPKPVKR
jgi:hypothetical protein